MKKGDPKTGGRQKGTPNKHSGASLQRIIDTAEHLEEKGLGLITFALKHPEAFWTKIYTKTVPKEINLPPDSNFTVHISTKEIKKEDKAVADSEVKD